MLTQQLRKKANTAQLTDQEQGLYDALLNLAKTMEGQVMGVGSDLVTDEATLDPQVVAEEVAEMKPVLKRHDQVAEFIAEARKQDIIDRHIEWRIEQHEERRLKKSHQPEWKPNQ